MVNKLFGSIDFGKLALDTASGFIVTTALLLLVDSFTPVHLVADILNVRSGGYIVVAGFIVIVVSSILGLMFDSLFHTFGRRFAQKIWPSLDAELKYRKDLMNDIGLDSDDEFEWIQSHGREIKPGELERNYMRYTEVAGASAYATVFLSAALALFLRWEYNKPLLWMTLLVSLAIAAAAVILLFTSSAALEKYELNKTAMAMDEIRRINPHPRAKRRKCRFWRKRSLLSLLSLGLFFPALIACFMGAHCSNPNTPKDMAVISTFDNGTVVLISINATENLTSATPLKPISASQRISLDNTMYHCQKLSLEGADDNGTADLVQLAGLPDDPGWQLRATLGDEIAAGNVYVNVQLSFDTPDNSKLHAGNWLLPLIVKDDSNSDRAYLLAYVQVTIEATE